MSAGDGLAELLGREPGAVWAAPGRVNVIGEHTDYNDGFVLPIALDYHVEAAVARRRDGRLRMRSAQEQEPVEVAVAELARGTVTGWAAYVAGVVWALGEAGHDVGGLDVAVDGDVPPGAGLSSSAALECSVACAVDEVLGLGLSKVETALLAQRAENDFVGMPCGAMDQLAAMLGEAGQAVFVDTRSLESRTVPLDPAAHGLAMLLVDTQAPHQLTDGAYASRRTSCEQAARALGVPALRDVEDLDGALSRLDDEVLRRRVRHVVTEDARVLESVRLLESGRLAEIGPLLTASHVSLREDYEVTVDELDVAVEAALEAGALGARMTGGGFGGSIVALIPAGSADEIGDHVRRAFSTRGFTAPQVLRCTPSQGAHRLR